MKGRSVRKLWSVAAFVLVIAPSSLVAGDAALWSRTYDGPGHGQDEATGQALFGDFVYTVGTLRNSLGDDDAVVYCHRKDGSLVWTYNFGGSPGDDYFSSVTVDGAGNPYVLALYTTDVNNGYSVIRLYKFHPGDNTVQWSRDLLPAGYVSARSEHFVYLDNALVLTGNVRNSGGNTDLYVASVSSDNVLNWENSLDVSGGGPDYGQVIAAGTGAVFVAGTAGADFDVYVARFRSDTGGKEWDNTVVNAGTDSVNGISVSTTSVFVAGTLANSTPGGDLTMATLLKFSASDGTEVWRKSVGRGLSGAINGGVATLAANGTVVFTGFLGGTDKDTFLNAYADNGALLWSRTLGEAGKDDTPAAIFFDGSRWVLLVVFPPSAGVKVFGQDGTLLGTVLFSDAVTGQYSLFAGAIDNSGNVFLAGRVSTGSDEDFFIGKVGPAPSSGSGGGGGCDFAASGPASTTPSQSGILLLPGFLLLARRVTRKMRCNIRRFIV